jgi:type VI secretion system secreted protein Hcp
MAAVDYFLKIDGVDGESTDDKHKGEIDVESFSWGVTQTGTQSSGGGGATGKVQFLDFNFTKAISKASPKLMQACANGQHIKQAVFVGQTASGERGGNQFLKYTFSDILVSSFQEGGSAGGIIDAAALKYASVKTEAMPGVTVGVTPGAVGNLMLDATTGQVIVMESQSGLLMSGPSVGQEHGSSLCRGVVEYSLKELVGVIDGPDPCALMLDIREVRQPSDTTGGEDPEHLPEGRRRAPGPVKKLSRHDVYWYGPADLQLTPDDFSRQAHRLGSLQADPSGEPAEASFDLCEIVKKHGLDSVGIRIQSAMDHSVPVEQEGESPPPDPDSGPPFTIESAMFDVDLALAMN